MIDTIELKALYKANKVTGRGEFCPRKGIYFIIDIKKGTCYGKEALIASARWKPNITDGYCEDFTVNIQLESFKSLLTLNKESWRDREIVITHADYQKEDKQFTLDWELLPVKTISLATLNNFLDYGDELVVSSLLEATNDIDLDNDSLDYIIDDGLEY